MPIVIIIIVSEIVVIRGVVVDRQRGCCRGRARVVIIVVAPR